MREEIEEIIHSLLTSQIRKGEAVDMILDEFKEQLNNITE